MKKEIKLSRCCERLAIWANNATKEAGYYCAGMDGCGKWCELADCKHGVGLHQRCLVCENPHPTTTSEGGDWRERFSKEFADISGLDENGESIWLDGGLSKQLTSFIASELKKEYERGREEERERIKEIIERDIHDVYSRDQMIDLLTNLRDKDE